MPFFRTWLAPLGLAVANISFSQVLIWHDVDNAIAGNVPDAILGADGIGDTSP